MKRSERMQPVRKLKQQEERQLARKFARAQQELQREQKQLTMLRQYQAEYFQGLTGSQQQARTGSISASELEKYQMFLSRLEKAIQNQHQVTVIKEKSVEAARQKWAEANARLKAMDNLIAKMRFEEAREQDRREQRMIDDLPLRNNRYD
ncbi:MAG: flagellar export protein FliJ [Ketobacteraceae bacterium]|nr:flagellar export protein FliJ [Ketobacteraceae bacterium]